jgi:hypothetical protein
VRRVALSQQYTLTVRTPSVQRQLRTEQEVGLELSRDIARLDPAFRAFAAQFARGLGVPAPVRAQLRVLERGVPDGFPVRTTSDAITITGSDTLRTSTRAELRELRQVPVDTSLFVAPAGYRVTEMSRLLQRRVP